MTYGSVNMDREMGFIMAGKSKPLKDGNARMWVKKPEDVTDKAVDAVFEWMYNQAEETGACSVTVDGLGTMSFQREKRGAGGE